jgi:NDP-sugar pyrophosphorylase family protein
VKIIIPMAGRGARLQNHALPKPLVRVAGRPMVAWAWESVAQVPCSRVVFIALRDHEEQFGVTEVLRGIAGADARVILLDQVTDGQLRTVLAARDELTTDEDILIAASDTVVESRIGDAVRARRPDVRGLISVLPLAGDRWSFARTDEGGRVVEVAEKERISPHASTGLYYFASGRELVAFADELIASGQKTRGEYYVMPVYQRYIDAGLRIELDHAAQMHDLGTPEALAAFEQLRALDRR